MTTVGTETIEALALDLEAGRRARPASLPIEDLDNAASVGEAEIERLWLTEAEYRCR